MNSIREIIKWCDENNKDAVEHVLDYLREKDSHVSRTQADYIVQNIRLDTKKEKLQ